MPFRHPGANVIVGISDVSVKRFMFLGAGYIGRFYADYVWDSFAS